MKWSCLISLFLISVTINAQKNILDKRIKGAYEQEALAFILRDINYRYYDINIRYNKDLLPENKLSLSFTDSRLRDVLNIILKDVPFDYILNSNGNIILAPQEIIDDSLGLKLINIKDDQTLLNEPDVSIIGDSSNVEIGDINIKGKLYDEDSFEPIPDAIIMNKTTGEFAITDYAGEFELSVQHGLYIFNINSLTHEQIDVTAQIYSSDLWEIPATQKAHLIEEVVISGQGVEHNVRETITGLELLSKREIKKLPTFMGEADLVKSLLSISGVSTIGEGSSGFNVRGGAIDQNLILQDGSLVFNPSHVLGFFSSFNPEIIKFSSLYKGHIPANYGGRVSSVLDVTLKEARMDNVSFAGSVGLISSKIALEIPLIKNKASILVAGRKSYTKWLISDINDLDIQRSIAKFGDANIKFTYKFTEQTKINISYFNSSDRFQFSDDFGYSWQNNLASIKLNHIINDRLSISLDGAYGQLTNEQFEPTGPQAFSLTSGISYLKAKSQLLSIWGDHTIKLGISAINYNNANENLRPINNSIARTEEINKEDGQELAIFINDQYNLSDNLGFDAGIRFSFYQQIGPAIINTYEDSNDPDIGQITNQQMISSGTVKQYSGIEPRISMRYSINKKSSIKLSYNRINQFIHLISNTATPTPVDIWQVSNTYLEPLRAHNTSLGYFHSIENGYDISGELYYRRLKNTLDFKDFSQLLLNPNLETSVIRGIGRSYGAELSIEKTKGNLTGRFSYSYSKSERRSNQAKQKINRGNWFPSNYDQPHNVKIALNWQANKRGRFGLNFVFNTGRPITGVKSNYILQGNVVTNFSDRNDFRLPDYHRLDLSYTFTMNRLKSARWQSEINISVYNIYSRRNAFSIFYDQSFDSQLNALKLSVIGTAIPSISYNFKW